jgi:hypothetical protein
LYSSGSFKWIITQEGANGLYLAPVYHFGIPWLIATAFGKLAAFAKYEVWIME